MTIAWQDISEDTGLVALGSDPEATVNEIAEQLPDKNIVLDCAGNEVLPSVTIAGLIRLCKAARKKSRDFGLVGPGDRLYSIFQAFRV